MASPAKPDTAPPTDRASDADELPADAAAARRGGLMAWLPLVAGVVVAPVLTGAVMIFVVAPQLQQRLARAPAAPATAAVAAEAPAPGHPEPAPYYEFSNVVVNLAGTMGTRYLKTSFQVIGEAKGPDDIHKLFEQNRSKLQDTTLNVLSAITLADLDEPGAKNVIRERLVGAYNEALGRHVARQVYFSEFVIQ